MRDNRSHTADDGKRMDHPPQRFVDGNDDVAATPRVAKLRMRLYRGFAKFMVEQEPVVVLTAALVFAGNLEDSRQLSSLPCFRAYWLEQHCLCLLQVRCARRLWR